MAFLICFAITCLITWGIVASVWFGIYPFLLSLIPATATNAWVGKLAITAMVAWFGGIGIPLGIFIWGTIISAAIWVESTK